MINQLYFYNAHSMQKSMLGTFELTKEDKDEALLQSESQQIFIKHLFSACWTR